MKKSIIALLVLSITVILSGCGNSVEKAVNQVKSVVGAENEHVTFVKEGYLDSEPNYTVGELFNNFFGNPKWTYFKADTGEDVVEFTGDMMYLDTEVSAKLQILIDGERFEFGALAFNEVPQTELITSAVLSAILEEMNDTVDTVESTTNQENEDWIIRDLHNGFIGDFQFGIGNSIDFVVDAHGEPVEADMYGGSYYLLYDNFTVFNDTLESQYAGLVSGISIHGGTVLGLTIGATSADQVASIIGEPADTFYDEEQGYLISYYYGDYILEIGADDEFSPINYIYYH